MNEREHNEAQNVVIESKDRNIDAVIATQGALSAAFEIKGALQQLIIQWDKLFEKIRSVENKTANLRASHNKLKSRVDEIFELFEDAEPTIGDEGREPERREKGKKIRYSH